jgi:1,4-dihydroxy-2-naphthoyl-CoA hydrolase
MAAPRFRAHCIVSGADREDTMDLSAQFNSDPLPFAKLLGIDIVVATPERIVGEMTVGEHLCTRPAVLHGGAIMAFADTLAAAATLLNLPEGAGTTTIESKTNFLAPAPLGTKVIGEATPVHRGKRTMVWQTRIATEAGRAVALVTQTQMVLER